MVGMNMIGGAPVTDSFALSTAFSKDYQNQSPLKVRNYFFLDRIRVVV